MAEPGTGLVRAKFGRRNPFRTSKPLRSATARRSSAERSAADAAEGEAERQGLAAGKGLRSRQIGGRLYPTEDDRGLSRTTTARSRRKSDRLCR